MNTHDTKFSPTTSGDAGDASAANQGFGQHMNQSQPYVVQPVQIVSPAITKRMLVRRQEQAFLAGGIIITTMGLDIAINLCIWLFRTQWSFYGLSAAELLHATISWNLAFIVGAAVGAFAVREVSKKHIYYISAIILIVSGALKIPDWSLATIPITSRYLAGFAQGLAFLTTIIHASEVTSAPIRGRSLGSINFYISVSLCCGFIFTNLMVFISDNIDFYADNVIGIIELIAAILAIPANYFTFIESPVFFLEKNQASNAVACLAKLRYEHVSSPNLANDLADLQQHINEGGMGCSWKAVLRAMLIRSIYSVATLTFINEFVFALLFNDMTYYGLYAFYGARMITEVVSMLLIDSVGRRNLLLISTGVSGVFALAVGCMFLSSIDQSAFAAFSALLILYSVAVGLGLGTVSVTYIGESFAGRQKGFHVFLVLMAEQAVQIIAMVILWYTVPSGETFFLPIASVLIVSCILFHFIAPETKGLTLRQSRHALQKLSKN